MSQQASLGMFDTLWAELPSTSDVAARLPAFQAPSFEMPSRSDITSRLPAFETPSFEMTSLSGIGCCERAKQSEDKEYLYAQGVESTTPCDEDDADVDGHPMPVPIHTSSMLSSESVEARIRGAASPSRASHRQPPYIPKLPLVVMSIGLKTVEAATTSEQPCQSFSGRSVKSILTTGRYEQPPTSSRSVKSLSGWYLDVGCNSRESTCASDTDHFHDMPQTTTSSWFLDGHKHPSARTPATTCFKMSREAPEFPEN